MTAFFLEDIERLHPIMRIDNSPAVGATSILLRSIPESLAGQDIVIDPYSNPETRTVTIVDGRRVYFSTPLTYAHAIGAPVKRLDLFTSQAGNLNVGMSNYLVLRGYYIWVDGTGILRAKNGVPASDTDGQPVGGNASSPVAWDLTAQIDGSTAAFTLPEAILPGSLRVYLNRQFQIPGVDFSETTSTTFTMGVAPLDDSTLLVEYIKA